MGPLARLAVSRKRRHTVSKPLRRQKEVQVEQRRERGLKRLSDGRWQFSWWYKGHYHRRIVPTKGEARAYLEKIHTQIREGRYLDRKEEIKTTFEEAVRRFLEWSEANTRRASHRNDQVNAPLWLESPHFKGKTLDTITAGDIEKYRLDRLKGVDRRGPSLRGLMLLAGRRYKEKTGKTLKYENRREVLSALAELLSKHSGAEVREAMEQLFRDASPVQVSQFRIQLSRFLGQASSPGKVRHLSKRTVDVSLARLKRMFTLCVDWGLCTQNPAAKVRLFREDPKRVRYLTEEEEARLMKACSPYLRQVVTFALHTGMRRGEILGLRWQDVDLRNAVATIPAARAKGRRDRYVPLNTDAMDILAAIPTPLDRSALIFANSAGNLNENFRRHWQAAIEQSGLEDFRFHDLRHTFASRLVMAGVDLAVLRDLLGHRDFEMTLRYAHLAPSHLRAAVAILQTNLRKTCDRPPAGEGVPQPSQHNDLINNGVKWCARRDSNPRPLAPEANALSN